MANGGNMAQQGLGKTVNRQFQKTVNQAVRDFIHDFEIDPSGYTPDDFDAAMEQILSNYYQDMLDQGVKNFELWVGKAQDFIEEKREKLEANYPEIFDDIPHREDDEETLSDEEEEPDYDSESSEGYDGYIDIDGQQYPTVTNNADKAYMKAIGAVRRNNVFPTLEELAEYIAPIPYIKGIEIVTENGYFEGYAIWVGFN